MTFERATLETEVDRLVETAERAGATLRVLGSIGVSRHCPHASALLPAFARRYVDIDLAAYRRDARTVATALAQLGFREDREVEVTSEGQRGYYDHPNTGVHVDVFFDRLEFCHMIPITGRLEADRPTIPLAELLLSKLQIVRINEKDVVDVILLLLDHTLGSTDDDVINADVVARLCAADWGLWRTVTGNLEKVATLAGSYPQLSRDQCAAVDLRLVELAARLELEPKSFGWRTRARIGERVKWWTDVDEVR